MTQRRIAMALIGLLLLIDLVVAAQLWSAWQDRHGAAKPPATDLAQAPGPQQPVVLYPVRPAPCPPGRPAAVDNASLAAGCR